jgi:hypothetical protein
MIISIATKTALSKSERSFVVKTFSKVWIKNEISLYSDRIKAP